MDIYKQAVWNELKNTMAAWDIMIEKSQTEGTAHLVTKEQIDRMRHKINGLMSQLDEKAA